MVVKGFFSTPMGQRSLGNTEIHNKIHKGFEMGTGESENEDI